MSASSIPQNGAGAERFELQHLQTGKRSHADHPIVADDSALPAARDATPRDPGARVARIRARLQGAVYAVFTVVKNSAA